MLVLSCYSASSENPANHRKSREPVTAAAWLTLQLNEDPEWFKPDNPGAKIIEEQTGVSINWILFPGDNVQKSGEAFSIMMASDDIPDMVIGNVGSQLKNYYQDWFPIDTAIRKNPGRYPNLDKYVLNDNYLKFCLPESDGHFRYIPMLSFRRIGDILMVRGDLLEKYNLSEPISANDWYIALSAAKKDGKIPYMTRYQRWGILYRLMAGYMDCVIEDYFVEDGKVKYGILDSRFRETIELARKWYAEGLIDPDYPDTDASRWWEEVLEGNVFATHDNIQRIPSANNDYINNRDQPVSARLIGVGPMQSKYTGKRNTLIHYPKVRDRSAAISVKSKIPERILDYFEYCFSDAGFILMNFGIEGISFNYVNNIPVMDPDFGIKAGRGELPYIVTIRDMPKNQKDELLYDYNLDREDHQLLREARDLYASNDFIRENWIASLSFTEEERAVLIPIQEELNSYRGFMLDRFIMGLEPMENWDIFMANLLQMKLMITIDIYQTALDRLHIN